MLFKIGYFRDKCELAQILLCDMNLLHEGCDCFVVGS